MEQLCTRSICSVRAHGAEHNVAADFPEYTQQLEHVERLLSESTLSGSPKATFHSIPHSYTGQNFGVFPLMLESADIEEIRVISREIVFEVFQPSLL